MHESNAGSFDISSSANPPGAGLYEPAGRVTGAADAALGGRFSYMSDNIVLLTLEVKEKVKRKLAILKARGTAHDLAVHELEIAAAGARVTGSKD